MPLAEKNVDLSCRSAKYARLSLPCSRTSSLGAAPLVGKVPRPLGERPEPEERARAARARRSGSAACRRPGPSTRPCRRRGAPRSGRRPRARARPGAAAAPPRGRRARRTRGARASSAATTTSEPARLLEVEALHEVRDRGRDHERDRELPRAALAPGEPAREPEQAEPERERQCPREVGNAVRENARGRSGSGRPSPASPPTRSPRGRRAPSPRPSIAGDDRAAGDRAYSLTRTRRSSSSLPGSRIASTESPGSSCIVSSGISALPLRTTEIRREPCGSCDLPDRLAGAVGLLADGDLDDLEVLLLAARAGGSARARAPRARSAP